MSSQLTNTIIQDARAFHAQGLLPGTSGDLSARVDRDRFIITVGGRDQSRLTHQDFTICGLDGKLAEEGAPRPSAEAMIHSVIYKRFDHVGAVYHVHDLHAALCSARDRDQEHTRVSGVEMIKGLDIWDSAAILQIPILPNHANVPTLATAVKEALDGDRGRWPAPCVNILRHGLYTWGKNAFEAKRHVETLAYLFRYSWEWERSPPSQA